MLEKIKKINIPYQVFLGLGAVLIIAGGIGIFNILSQQKQQSDLATMEIPREMIESGYSSFTGDEDEDGGFTSLYLPNEDEEEIAVPTLQTITQESEDPDLLQDPPADLDSGSNLVEVPEENGDSEETGTTSETEENTADTEEEETDSGGAVPEWIYIPSLKVQAPIVPATKVIVEIEVEGEMKEYIQWDAPNEPAVGWHPDSALLGEIGNTVLNGHHNAHGKVFGTLAYLQEGDFIQVYGDDGEWYTYVVSNKMVLPERDMPLEIRLQNAAWLLPSQDERLTLVTCWPEQNNTHRLIIVAQPYEVVISQTE